jgi:hypothetical protein
MLLTILAKKSELQRPGLTVNFQIVRCCGILKILISLSVTVSLLRSEVLHLRWQPSPAFGVALCSAWQNKCFSPCFAAVSYVSNVGIAQFLFVGVCAILCWFACISMGFL